MSSADLRCVVVQQSLRRFVLGVEDERVALKRECGMYRGDAVVVEYVDESGSLSPKELGARLALSSGNTSAVLSRLERAGHVRREPHPEDGRSVLVRVSRRTHDWLTRVRMPLSDAIDELARGVTDAELEVVQSFLAGLEDATWGRVEQRGKSARVNLPADRPPIVPGLWG